MTSAYLQIIISICKYADYEVSSGRNDKDEIACGVCFVGKYFGHGRTLKKLSALFCKLVKYVYTKLELPSDGDVIDMYFVAEQKCDV